MATLAAYGQPLSMGQDLGGGAPEKCPTKAVGPETDN
ncbi:hypothetical protein C7402_11977 [Paraburkholderia unamae]|uniref:Uncharacterized protein n=1 Tax=Paraburkholderia unamae TaxID=219649 RepID=A0ABX5KIL6_9BURK|nr:hypothetical protein C7402_11977 [Paraburkholderia unamae]